MRGAKWPLVLLAAGTVSGACGSSQTHAGAPAGAARAASGSAARFYLRPVYCELPAYAAPPAGGNSVPAAPVSKSACDSTNMAGLPTTPPGRDEPSATVILPTDPAAFGSDSFRYVLGPADMDGSAISTAAAVVDPATGQHSIDLTLTSAGAVELDRLASARFACYQQDPNLPPPCSLEAFELNGVVESAPTFQASSFNGHVALTGNFTAGQVSALVNELRSASGRAGQGAATSG